MAIRLARFYNEQKRKNKHFFSGGQKMRRRANLSTSLLMLVFLVVMACTTAGQTIFVDMGATGANNGSSCACANHQLQDALTSRPVCVDGEKEG